MQLLMTCPLFLIISWSALFLHIGPSFDYLSLTLGLFSGLSLLIFLGSLDSYLKEGKRMTFRALLIFLMVLNTEHILVNGAHIDLGFSQFAFSRTFFLGSLLNLRLLALALFTSTFFMVSHVLTRKLVVNVPRGPLIGLGALLLLIDVFLSERLPYSSWFQKNPVSFNLRNLTLSWTAEKTSLIRENTFVKDLNGQKLPEAKGPVGKRPTILLLIMEGFSETYVREGLAPNLKRFLDENFHAPHFLANQVQTNRGLYSLLCNDYPNIGNAEAKADIIASRGPLSPCLPSLLKNAGYSTFYMQSAPLEFMRKDLFAKASGFDWAAGARSFEAHKLISEWGVSDGTLFEGALNALATEEIKRPLFMTMLTVSTHHPYVTPNSREDLIKAIRYTDEVFGDFYQALKEARYFEENALIVTSDEARPFRTSTSLIADNWSLFGMAGPGISKAIQPGLFSQVDVGMTIADYLGIADEAPLRGRSLLRSYTAPRDIYVGNAFLKRPMLVTDEKTLHLCNLGMNCVVAGFKNSLFDPTEKPQIAPSNRREKIRSFIANSDLTFEKISGNLLFTESDLNFRKIRMVLGDFKTPMGMSDLSYRILLGKEGDVKRKITFRAIVYTCGVPDSTIERVVLLDKEENLIQLTIPERLRGQTLCHTVSLESPDQETVAIKKFDFFRVDK